MKLYAPSTIKAIREKHDFKLSKSLGQNFLTDKNIIDRIIEGSDVAQDDLVVEIGPGIGVLTAAAAEVCSKVVSIEIDKNLLPILDETLALYENIQIINGDVLKVDLTKIIEENRQGGGVRIIGNLPYYITTPIIMKILEGGAPADSITVMMQKEVADRIKALPGSKTYGAISAAVQYYCTVEQIAAVPKEVFVPQPKVDSAVLRLDIRKEKPVDLLDEALFWACIRGGFGKRRKTLLNSLTGVAGLSKESVKKVLEAASIDPIRRAETLSIEEFAKVANEIYHHKQQEIN